MKTALLDGDRSLFTVLQPPGTAWQVNRDAICGFVRQPTGALTGAERDTRRFLEARHGRRNATPVRVFPRAVEAPVLGGLRQIVGNGYRGFRTILARYALTGYRVAVVNVVTDGVPRGGTVSVPTARRCG